MTADRTALARLPDLHVMREKRAHEEVRRHRRALVEAEQALRIVKAELDLARDNCDTLKRWTETVDREERTRFVATAEARMQLLDRRCADLGTRLETFEADREMARAELAAAQTTWQHVRARADAVTALAKSVRADQRRLRELRTDRSVADELAAYMGGPA